MLIDLQENNMNITVADPGEGPGGGPVPPLFLDQTEAQRAEKNFFQTVPPYLRVWMTAPPRPLSEGLDLPLR